MNNERTNTVKGYLVTHHGKPHQFFLVGKTLPVYAVYVDRRDAERRIEDNMWGWDEDHRATWNIVELDLPDVKGGGE